MKEGVGIGSIIGGIRGVLLVLILMLMYYKRYSQKPVEVINFTFFLHKCQFAIILPSSASCIMFFSDFLNGIRKLNPGADLSVKVPSHIRSCSFSIAQLRTTTQNFSQEIGKGGFGTVFYGKLPDGKEIAVKVLPSSSKQGELEF